MCGAGLEVVLEPALPRVVTRGHVRLSIEAAAAALATAMHDDFISIAVISALLWLVQASQQMALWCKLLVYLCLCLLCCLMARAKVPFGRAG